MQGVKAQCVATTYMAHQIRHLVKVSTDPNDDRQKQTSREPMDEHPKSFSDIPEELFNNTIKQAVDKMIVQRA